jgi:hypothetical protein
MRDCGHRTGLTSWSEADHANAGRSRMVYLNVRYTTDIDEWEKIECFPTPYFAA